MHCFIRTGVLPVLLAVSSGAQSPPILTEADYLAVLDEAHPAVREGAAAVALARAGLREAATLENPVVSAEREDLSGPSRLTEIIVSWQLPAVARRAQIAAREGDVEAVRARSGERLLAAHLSMREAYAGWAIAEARYLRLAAQADRVEALARREAARSEIGEASGLAAHRLRLAATALRTRTALAAAETERARATALAWHPAAPSDARPLLPELPAVPAPDGPGTRLRVAEAELAAARLARTAAGRFLRSPAVRLGWQSEETGPVSVDGPTLGISWSVPLSDRRRAAREAADARVAASTARFELAELELDASRAAAKERYASLFSALDRARGELAVNQRMLDGAEAAFRYGETGLTDLLETHRSVTEAELALLDLHAAVLAVHRELVRLTGPAAANVAGLPPTPDPVATTPTRENSHEP